jgi:hypothetical protein
MGNDLRARVQTLARLRRGRIGVSDRWHSSSGTARDDYLICYRAPAALVISANSVHFARAITSSAPGGGHRPEYARYFSGPTLRRTRRYSCVTPISNHASRGSRQLAIGGRVRDDCAHKTCSAVAHGGSCVAESRPPKRGASRSHRTINAGTLQWVSTSYAWLPSKSRETPRRPCDAMTIKSHPFSLAVATIPSAGC